METETELGPHCLSSREVRLKRKSSQGHRLLEKLGWEDIELSSSLGYAGRPLSDREKPSGGGRGEGSEEEAR